MTIERQPDPEATVEMPAPVPQRPEEADEFDPEKTLVREDWESAVIRRVAPHVAKVRSELGEELDEARCGWESEGLRRLSREINTYKNTE